MNPFDRFQNKFKVHSNIGRTFLESLKLSKKNGFVFVDQIWLSIVLNQYSMAQKIRLRVLTDFKTNLQQAPM